MKENTQDRDWEGAMSFKSTRFFWTHPTQTCFLSSIDLHNHYSYQTVDTFYRRCSSANYIGNVSVPLLCISALDDPLCTREVIPWDECRANKNVVLATTPNGDHLAFFSRPNCWKAMNEDGDLWDPTSILPAGLMAFYGNTKPLDKSWHVMGLGYNPSISPEMIRGAVAIHFNGNMKPWLDITLNQYKAMWTKYVDTEMIFLTLCSFGSLKKFKKCSKNNETSNMLVILAGQKGLHEYYLFFL